jgi:hypothetical protein
VSQVAAHDELVRALVSERGARVLHVVVERAVHVLDPTQAECHQSDPVVVEGAAVARRKGQHELQELAAEERRRARDRVGDQERGEVRVVVAAVGPEGVGDGLALAGHDAGVAVDEVRVA